MAKLIAKISHPDNVNVNANLIICAGDAKDSYLCKWEYKDADGKVAATSVKWRTVSKSDLRGVLVGYEWMTDSKVDELLGADDRIDTLAYLFGE